MSQVVCEQLRVLAGERVSTLKHSTSIKRHTGFERQVVAKYRAHADRVTVVIGDPEIEHRAAERSRLNRVAQCRDLMAHRFYHDVRPVIWRQVTHPSVAGGTDNGVDAEILAEDIAIDWVD